MSACCCCDYEKVLCSSADASSMNFNSSVRNEILGISASWKRVF